MTDHALRLRFPWLRLDGSRLVGYAYLCYCFLTPALIAAMPAVLIVGAGLSLPAALKTSVVVVGSLYVAGLAVLFR